MYIGIGSTILGLIEKSLKKVISHMRPEKGKKFAGEDARKIRSVIMKVLEQPSRANIQLKLKSKVKSKGLEISLIGFVLSTIGSHRKHLSGDDIMMFWQAYSWFYEDC